MANKGFNGTFVTFAGANLGSLTGCDFSSTAAKADVTDSADSVHSYAAGIPDNELTVDVCGDPTGAGVGSVGTLTLTWFDGTTSISAVSYVCVALKARGQMDGPITGSLTFVPSAA